MNFTNKSGINNRKENNNDKKFTHLLNTNIASLLIILLFTWYQNIQLRINVMLIIQVIVSVKKKRKYHYFTIKRNAGGYNFLHSC